jgi:Flp pilus assembly protein TadD
MKIKGSFYKAFSLFLAGNFFLFILNCSSTSGYRGNQSSSENSTIKRYKISDADVQKFVSSIRPSKADPNSLYQQARYFQDRKKHKIAIETLKEMILIDPTSVKAYNALGVSYDALGDSPRAIESYKAALNLNPDLAYVQNNLGYSFLMQGNLDEAIAAFQKAVSLDYRNSQYHNNLGLAYGKSGQFDQAFAEFSLAGTNAKAHYNLAKVYFQQGFYKEARFHFSKASTLKPSMGGAKKGLKASEALAWIAKPGGSQEHKDKPAQKPSRVGLDKHGKLQKFYTIPAQDMQTEKDPHQIIQVKDEPAQTPNRIGRDNHGKLKEFYTIPAQANQSEKDPRQIIQVKDAPAQTPHRLGSYRHGLAQKKYPIPAPETKVTKKKNPVNSNPLRAVPYERIQDQKEVPKQDVSDSEQRPSQATEKKHMMAFVPQKDPNVSSGLQTQGLVFKRAIPRTKKTLPAESLPRKFTSAEKRADLMTVDQPNAIKQRNSLKVIDIEISNGNGVNHMARGVGNYLKNRGHKVTRLTNADHFKYNDTMIYYRRGYLHDAYRVAQEIPRYQRMKKVNNFDRQNIKIKVLLGQDVVPYRKSFKREDAGS